MNRLKRIYSFLLFAVLVLIFIINCLTVFFPAFGKPGAVLWFISYALLFIFTIKCLWFILQKTIKKESLITLITLSVWLVIIIIHLTNWASLSGETTQEINCTLNHFQNSSDWGFNKTCLFNYPARQYFLPTLPSLVFGRSLLNLNLGGSLYFVMGIIIFAAGSIKFFNSKFVGDILSGILLSFIFHIYFVNHFLFLFEQSIFPFSLALAASGLFLMYLREKSKELLFLCGIINLYLIYSYTPSLALIFLIIAVLIHQAFHHAKLRKELIFIILITLSSFFISLSTRGDINLVEANRPHLQVIEDTTRGIVHLIFSDQGTPTLSPFLNIFFLLFVFSSLTFIFGWKSAAISTWFIGVIMLAVASKGYTYYGIDFRLHRATVIFPVFLATVAIIMQKTLSLINKLHPLLFVIWLFFLATGFQFQNEFLKSRPTSAHVKIIDYINRHAFIGQDEPATIYIDSRLTSYISLNDTLQYFFPHAVTVFNQDGKCGFIKENTARKMLYLAMENSQCDKIAISNFPEIKVIYPDLL